MTDGRYLEEMEPLVETLDLDIEESNDLAFKIKMEGMAASPAKVRLVCEGKDVSYMFNGYGTGEDEVVQFTLPKMGGRLQEGMYQARVEVLIDNRYFSPLQFQINFKKTLSVVAEAIKVTPRVEKQQIKVTATPVALPQRFSAQTIKFEQKKPEVETSPEVGLDDHSAPSLKTLYESKVDAPDTLRRKTLRQKFGKR